MDLITGLNKFDNQSENECSSEPKEGRVGTHYLKPKLTIPMIVLQFRTPIPRWKGLALEEEFTLHT